MTGKLTAKTLRGKEVFELYIKTNGDSAIFDQLAAKHELAVSTIKGDLYHYKNRSVHPRPTEKQLKRYDQIARQKQIDAGLNSVSKHQKTEGTLTYDEDLINNLLKLKFVKELLAFSIAHDLPVSAIIKNLESVIKNNELPSVEIAKLKKIRFVLNKNGEIINERRKVLAKDRRSALRNAQNIKIITSIIEEVLISGIDNLNQIIIAHEISRNTFDKHISLLKEAGEHELKLYNLFNEEVVKEQKELEDNYFQIIDYLKNGIVKNNISTYFNLLDYFRMTNLKPDEFTRRGYQLIREGKLERIDHGLVVSFFNSCLDCWRILTEEEALNFYYSVGDVEVSLDEKRAIIDYLENTLGTMLYTGLFQSACDEVIKGMLSLKKLTLE